MKVYLVYQWYTGPFANGDMDKCETRGIIFANNEAESEQILADNPPCGYTSKGWSEPIISEVGDAPIEPGFLEYDM